MKKKEKKFVVSFGAELGAYKAATPVAKSGNHHEDLKVTKQKRSKK